LSWSEKVTLVPAATVSVAGEKFSPDDCTLTPCGIVTVAAVLEPEPELDVDEDADVLFEPDVLLPVELDVLFEPDVLLLPILLEVTLHREVDMVPEVELEPDIEVELEDEVEAPDMVAHEMEEVLLLEVLIGDMVVLFDSEVTLLALEMLLMPVDDVVFNVEGVDAVELDPVVTITLVEEIGVVLTDVDVDGVVGLVA
jgi:hypothetical protein